MKIKNAMAVAAAALCLWVQASAQITIQADTNVVTTEFAPFIENDRTYVAVRTLCDILDADDVVWNEAERSVSLSVNGLQMVLTIGSDRVSVGDDILITSAVPIIRNDRTYLPIRFIAETFGAQVYWDGATRTVFINTQTPEEGLSDLDWLARIVNAESGNESYEGMLAVANVVLNRVKSNSFPNTIFDVIFHKYNDYYQFTPVANGWIYREPNAQSIQAAQAALNGENNVEDCLYFAGAQNAQNSWAGKNREYFATIGNHTFYR